MKTLKTSKEEVPIVFSSGAVLGEKSYYVDGQTYLDLEYCKSYGLQTSNLLFQCQPGQTIVAKEDHGWRCENPPMSTSHAVLLGSGMIVTAILLAACVKAFLMAPKAAMRARK